MDHRPEAWGRPRDDVYGPYDASYFQTSGPKQATQSPAVTGTSVIALKFKDGVVMAADNLASYGSLARFPSVHRLLHFPPLTAVGFSGDISDMQYLTRHLSALSIAEAHASTALDAASLHQYLTKLMYSRRNSMDPLWNHVLVAGFDAHDRPFLASADLRGTAFAAPALATGMAAMLALPLLRRVADTHEAAAQLTRDQAVEAVKECMRVLYYRDARSLDRYSIAVITKDGVDLREDEVLEKQSWAFADRIKGYGTQTV